MNKINKLFIAAFMLSAPIFGQAQTVTGSNDNTISTAVPFLTITPDSRAAGMGDVGVATSPDVNAQHWNAAKYAFIDQSAGIGASYSPWMKSMVDDMSLSYVSGFYKLDDRQALSASLRYFALGSFAVKDEANVLQAEGNPNEFAIDFAYSRKLSETFSGAVTIRYIRSNVAGASINDETTSPANAFAADVAFLYRSSSAKDRSAFSSGIVLSNIGSPISYDDGNTKDLLPANLRLGVAYDLVLDPTSRFNFALDFNKLMVPANSDDESAIGGIFHSFSDASLKEEMQEITTSIGLEYWYANQVALRTGYFNESDATGGRKYLTIGAGALFRGISFDIAYLYTFTNASPLENTLRFSLGFDLGTLF